MIARLFFTGFLISIFFPFANNDSSASLTQDDLKIHFSTYFGGRQRDRLEDLAVDSSGFVYIVGNTKSRKFPVKNAYQNQLRGVNDIFIAKINPLNSSVVYSTYFGGSDDDAALAVETDAQGNAYVVGGTLSHDFPAVNAWQSGMKGAQSAFVVKLDPNGNPIYSTYLGGSIDAFAADVTVDQIGQAHIIGATESSDFPQIGGLGRPLQDCNDLFISKFSPNGQLILSTLLGGSSCETPRAIGIDGRGNIYVGSSTLSEDFPVRNAAQRHNAGTYDFSLTKLNPTATKIFYSTYLGGTGADFLTRFAVTRGGTVWMTGIASHGFPAKNALFSFPPNGFSGYAVLAKFGKTGRLLYSSFFGGKEGGCQAHDVATDNAGNAYITGWTNATDYPLVHPIQQLLSKGQSVADDVFITKFDPTGRKVLFSTYLGGSYVDTGYAIDVSPAGDIYVGGVTESINFPRRKPIQNKLTGGFEDHDAFITVIRK